MSIVNKRFINNPSDVVEEVIQGVCLADPAVRRLDGLHVLVRADFAELKKSQVAVLSGGGSGHEPAMGGFVGDGLLTAAVAGGVFASPSVDAVLQAIRTVTGPAGCLVIIMNYTGDRLNFGQAIEKAKAEGLKVNMVVVADDCALPKDKGITGRRGVAGTVLVHKVAGAAAAAGKSLEEVTCAATEAINNVGTLGVALGVCSLPGEPHNDRLDGGLMELGLGIHGEPGMEQREHSGSSADQLVLAMLKEVAGTEEAGCQGYLPLAPNQEVALLINNLGAVPELELAVLARKAISALEAGEVGFGVPAVHVARVWTGTFMSSLNMNGASISLMRLDPALVAALDAPASSGGWRSPTMRPVRFSSAPVPVAQPPPAAAHDAEPVTPAGEELRAGIKAAAEALLAGEGQLTLWDQVAGDGDCGITAKRGAEQVLQDLSSYPVNDVQRTLHALADSVSASMGGTSGALYELALRAAAGVAGQELCHAKLAEGFGAGVKAMEFYGGARVGYRTMLDALVPAEEALREGTLEQAVVAAEEGAQGTAEMKALAGRSNYVPDEKLQGTPDPGAKAVAFMLRAVLESQK